LVDNFSPESGNYENLWQIGETELENFVFHQEKQKQKKKQTDAKNKNAIDDIIDENDLNGGDNENNSD
jgi:hypothetical protein